MKRIPIQHGKRIAAVLLLFLLLLLPSCAQNEKEANQNDRPRSVSLYFFHDTACGACDGTKDFLSIFEEQIGDVRELYPYTLEMQNVFQTEGSKSFERVMEQYGLDPESASFPMLVINGKELFGLEEIEKSLRENFLSAGEAAVTPDELAVTVEKAPKDDLFRDFPSADPGESVVLYFYRSTCPECVTTKPVMDGLPETMEINGTGSTVTVYSLNSRTGSNPERIRYLFEKYEVPEDKQMVPIVFLRDSYLAGYDEISAGLEQGLLDGGGLDFDFSVFQE